MTSIKNFIFDYEVLYEMPIIYNCRIPEFGKVNNFNKIALEVYKVKAKDKEEIIYDEKGRVDSATKVIVYEYARQELKNVKKCFEVLGIDISLYKKDKQYQFDYVESVFIYFLLVIMTTKKGTLLSDLKTRKYYNIQYREIDEMIFEFWNFLYYCLFSPIQNPNFHDKIYSAIKKGVS